MSQVKYQIIVSGQIIEGFDLATVKRNVAQLFKTEVGKIEPLFSGQAVVVKKELDEAGARKYMMALKQAGLASKGRPMSTTGQGKPAAPTLGAAGETLDQTPPPPAADINTGDLSVGPVGDTLVQPSPIAEPDIDISAYQVEAAGSDLDRRPPPAKPDINTSHISVDEVGSTLDETPPAPEPEIATDHLSVAEAGEEIMKHPSVPPAQIDTSKLQLTD